MEDYTGQQEAAEKEREAAIASLDALAQRLAELRKDAVDFRHQSGVEDIWDEDQARYDGEDPLISGPSKYEKPHTSAGRPQAPRQANNGKSDVVVNITQPYVDMAAARVAGMLLPTDDRPFAIDPTPIPELDKYEGSPEPEVFPDGSQAPAADIVKEIRAAAAVIAERSEDRIWDWLSEAGWHAEARRVIEDAARIGTGCVKGPYPIKKKIKKLEVDEAGTRLGIDYETAPDIKRIDVKNLFPSAGCGEDIHNGDHLFERDYLTRKQLLALKGADYLDDQIDICLKEGPGGTTDPEAGEDKKKVYEVWYFHGTLTAEDMAVAGVEIDEMAPIGEGEVPGIVTLVNDRIIKAAQSPLDSGEFPYSVLPWQRRGGSWAGTGVARQVNTPQRMINAATRVMLNNGGLSSEPIVFMRRNGITPADGTSNYTLTPGKKFWVEESADMRSVQDAVFFVPIPNLQEQFAAIVQYALDLAERLTSMPMMMQGQQGTATETVGGMTILQNNAGAVLRRVAKLFDDNITVPLVGRLYEYLLLYGEDQEEKGDNVIVARGSTALFERDAQDQNIMQMAAIVKDPAFGIDPNKWIIEAFKAQKLDPARFQFTDEEKQKMAEAAANQQPPVDPRIAGSLEVAKLRADGDLQKAQITNQSDMAELQLKQQIEGAKLAHEREQAELQRQHLLRMKEMDVRMAEMEFALKSQLNLDGGKIKLADTSMKLQVQKDLSDKALRVEAGKQIVKPPTEPVMRADAGQAFEE